MISTSAIKKTQGCFKPIHLNLLTHLTYLDYCRRGWICIWYIGRKYSSLQKAISCLSESCDKQTREACSKWAVDTCELSEAKTRCMIPNSNLFYSSSYDSASPYLPEIKYSDFQYPKRLRTPHGSHSLVFWSEKKF